MLFRIIMNNSFKVGSAHFFLLHLTNDLATRSNRLTVVVLSGELNNVGLSMHVHVQSGGAR